MTRPLAPECFIVFDSPTLHFFRVPPRLRTSSPSLLFDPFPPLLPAMSTTKKRSIPRIVCCAIPIARASGKVLVITSRKHSENWVCEFAFQTSTAAVFRCLMNFPYLLATSSHLAAQLIPPGISAERRLGDERRYAGSCRIAGSVGRRLKPSAPLPAHSPLTRFFQCFCIALHSPCTRFLRPLRCRKRTQRVCTVLLRNT